jgi:multidrug efflux pump
VAFPGLSINGFVNAPNTGIAFVVLKPSEERKSPELSAGAIVGALNQQFFAQIPGSRSSRSSRRRRCRGSGPSAASSSTSKIAAGQGFEDLYGQLQASLAKGSTQPSLAGLFSSFQVSVPQIDATVDRERVKSYGVPLTDVFETLQVYLGSLYVNDFNRFGRTYQVNAQAESASVCSPSRFAGCRRATTAARWCRSGRSSASRAATGRIR